MPSIEPPEPLNVSKIPASMKNERIKFIHRDAARYNVHFQMAKVQRRLNPNGAVEARIVDLLDSIFKNAIAYMLLKPPASRGDKGQQRTQAIIRLIDEIELHAQFHGIKFLVSSFEENQVNYWLEREDRKFYGDEAYKDFLKWVETTEKTNFKDTYAGVSSKLVYLTESGRQKYEVHFDGQLIKDSHDKSITTSGRSSFSNLEADIYVCSARTRTIYSAPSDAGTLHHSSFMSGEPVIVAGDWVIENGRLVYMNTASGHYRPTIGNMRTFLSLYGGFLNPQAWVQPLFKGPVFKLRDYWLFGEAAKPDPKGAEFARPFVAANEGGAQPVHADKPGTYMNR
jgi:hypothetical protein